MKNFKSIYQEEYEKLNKQQKQAVDTVEGPVMVIAGPGTGKTQILSRRVANILTNYHTNPEEIVCLTYTEAGASEMLDRLEGLIGEEGRKVRVSTIHAFCSELILANSKLFGEEPKVITDAVKYEILKEIMDEYIKEDSPFYKNSGNRYSSKDQLLELFTKIKRENIDKDDFKIVIDEYFKMIDLSVPGEELYKKFKYTKKYKDKKPGDFKAEYDKERQRMQKLLAGVEIVEKYKNKINEHNYFDFDDMILWIIKKLEVDNDFQSSISNSIKYLFVDEFQDTSVVQNKLVDLLVKGKTSPNIFVVGDDDQSIFRFQGVSANNIQDFDKKYQPRKIVLEENYRSSQAIIDASRQLISHNPREEKVLVAAGDNKYYNYQLPILKSYRSVEDEMFGVLSEIKNLIHSGVSPNEIGVIYGRNSYGEEFANILRDNGIFVQIKEKQNLFDNSFFKKISAILKYICQNSKDVRELRKIIYFDFFEVGLSEIATIRNLKKDENILIPSIEEIDKKLENIRKKVSNSEKYLSPMNVLSYLVKSLEIDEYIMKSKERYNLVSVLNELYKLMLTECQIHPNLTIRGFLNKISALQEMKINLPIETISGAPSNCIQLMTAHGSKGLENRRLFYVAMTRAKKVLHLSYSEEFSKTHFINDLVGIIDKVEVVGLPKNLQSKEEVVISKLPEDIVDEIMDGFSLSVSTLNAFLKCPLSFYFNKGLKLPSETNEAMVFGSIIHEVLEQIFISKDASQSSELTEKTVRSLEETLKLFETIFEEKSWQFSSNRIKRDNFNRGRKIIENLYNKPGYLKEGVIAVEHDIKGVKLGSILDDSETLSNMELNGKIDKIECDGDIIRLIDYKTGNVKNAKEKLVEPNEKEPIGGDYWRQAVFYYLLFTNSGFDISNKKVVVKYVFIEDSDTEEGFTETPDILISKSDTDLVLELIKEAFMKLEKGDFNKGCGVVKRQSQVYPCDHCIRVLDNVLPAFDNIKEIEVATYMKSLNKYKSLSVSKLNKFLNCQKSFYFDNVLQLTVSAGLSASPNEKYSRSTSSATPTGPVFGIVIHETLEKIYKYSLQLGEALNYYNDSLQLHKEEISGEMSINELREYGQQLLKKLYENYIPNSLKGENVSLEKEINVKLEGNFLINGIIDKLEYDNDIIRVVDYKTGSAERGVEELGFGGNYWRQAVFYTILLEHSAEIDTKDKRIEIQYIFLDDTTNDKGYSIHTVNVTKKDMNLVLSQIHNFWKLVNTADFTGGCNKDDCDYCRLAKFVDFKLLKDNLAEKLENK